MPQIAPGQTLWLLLDCPAQVHHGVDGRKRSPDIDTQGTGLSLQTVILPSSTRPAGTRIDFTLRWNDGDWAGRDWQIEVVS